MLIRTMMGVPISEGDARFEVRQVPMRQDCVGCNGWSIYLALDISSVIAALCYRSVARGPTPATEYITEKPTTCSEPESWGLRFRFSQPNV